MINMFIHFLCLYPLRLAILLNFNISKVAYSCSGSENKGIQIRDVPSSEASNFLLLFMSGTSVARYSDLCNLSLYR